MLSHVGQSQMAFAFGGPAAAEGQQAATAGHRRPDRWPAARPAAHRRGVISAPISSFSPAALAAA